MTCRERPTTLRVRLPAGQEPQPLLEWLATRFTYHPVEEWRRAVRSGEVLCNDKVAGSEDHVAAGDVIQLATAPDVLRVEILHEDERCLVVDKPAGSVVHAASAFPGRTFLRALAARVGREVLHCAHRLDRDTSGALLLAKDDAAMTALQSQFAAHSVRKEYLALTHGCWRVDRVDVVNHLGPAQGSLVRERRAVVLAGTPGAQTANTDFSVLLRLPRHTLVRATPRTGRTHQIRAHLEHLGHALVGDKLYGRDDGAYLADLERLRRGERPWATSTGCEHHLLHAAALTFVPPDAVDPVTVRAPLPAHLAAFLAGLRPDPGPAVQGTDGRRRKPKGP